MIPKEIFLSHASKDEPFVLQLADILRNHNLPFWYSPVNILGAQQWHDDIGAALARCDWFLLVLSPHSVQSMWVKRELMYALRQHRYENRIVPILSQPCDVENLSWVLSDFQFLDFRTDFETGARNLLKIWDVECNGPLTKTADS